MSRQPSRSSPATTFQRVCGGSTFQSRSANLTIAAAAPRIVATATRILSVGSLRCSDMRPAGGHRGPTASVTRTVLPRSRACQGRRSVRLTTRGRGDNTVLFKIDQTGKPIREVVDHPVLEDQSLQMSGFTHSSMTPPCRTRRSSKARSRSSGRAACGAL
jgi:hypothetical protein